jgi:hypothetical protein
MPFSFQFGSNMQSKAVRGGRLDGNGDMRDFPRTRDRSDVFGATVLQQTQLYGWRVHTHQRQQYQKTDASPQGNVYLPAQVRRRPNHFPNPPVDHPLHRRADATHRRPSFPIVPHTYICRPICSVYPPWIFSSSLTSSYCSFRAPRRTSAPNAPKDPE